MIFRVLIICLKYLMVFKKEMAFETRRQGNRDTELNTLNRIQDIDKLNEKDKELAFKFLDSFISNRKIKKALN